MRAPPKAWRNAARSGNLGAGGQHRLGNLDGDTGPGGHLVQRRGKAAGRAVSRGCDAGRRNQGAKTGNQEIDGAAKCSGITAPRRTGHARKGGPPARHVVGCAKGHEGIRNQVEGFFTR